MRHTISNRIGKDVKGIVAILKTRRATERHPVTLTKPVDIQQTVDGRGILDFVTVKVARVWHDRTTAVVETTSGETIRLVDTFETCGHHYLDSWWNVRDLKKAIS